MNNILVSAMGYDDGKSGISEYIRSTVLELAKNNKLDLIILKKDLSKFPCKGSANINVVVYSNLLASPVINMLWHLFILPLTINFKKYDFIFLPAGNRRLFFRYPIKAYVTMHDLSQFHIEAKYDKFRMFYVKRIVPIFLRKADRIFSISESTKKDLLKFYKLSPEKIVVNYNGFNSIAYNGLSNSSNESECFPSLANKKYMLYVARIEHPGKNHLNLIKAYELLPESLKEKFELIFAGSFWSNGAKVKDYADKSLDCKRIKFLGFVEEKKLSHLYQHASLYVFPSFYEGFGIPMLEAMSSNVPVVCSNTSSLPEVGGDAVLTFDPNNPVDIKSKIESVLINDEIKKDMIRCGKVRVAEFSWSKHCNKIIDEYENEKSENK
jgi:glycosyltransferase involved in cell wall biosynthesis